MKPLLSWKTEEHEHTPKSKAWFAILWLIFGALTAWALLRLSFLEALVYFLLGVVASLLNLKHPRRVTVKITPLGISINGLKYSYEDIESFWIFYDPPHVNYLSLKLKKTLLGTIHILLKDQDPVKVRKILLRFLAEEEQAESAIDVIARTIKF